MNLGKLILEVFICITGLASLPPFRGVLASTTQPAGALLFLLSLALGPPFHAREGTLVEEKAGPRRVEATPPDLPLAAFERLSPPLWGGAAPS